MEETELSKLLKGKIMLEDDLIFVNEDDSYPDSSENFWNILIVDDDLEVHSITKLALFDFSFRDKKLKFTSTYSAAETKILLDKNETIFSLVLLDIVMESSDAGLEVVKYIRDTLKQDIIRIIIRTGQPGEAPERFVIEHYDINDYKEKTELTTDRLFTSVRTALSDYQHMLELLNKKNELYNMLITDALTFLPNRFKLNNDVDMNNVQSLLLINIDSFSQINESYGFEVGNSILKEVGKLLKSICTNKKSVYRLEGDIFAILFKNEIIKTSETVSNIQTSISNHLFIIGKIELYINVSIGMVMGEIGNIVQKAELALRQARTVSRNRIQMYSSNLEIIKTIHLNTKWSQWIKEATDDDKIFPYFQPIIDCKTNEVFKYEVLVRLQKDGVTFTPSNFLNTVRYAGLLHTITKIVLEKSCKKFQNTDIKFSINLSDQDLIEINLIALIEEVSKKYNISSKQISFEILENNSITDNPFIKEQFHKLTSLGYELVIDDFGTECSNFAQLSNLNLSAIKIDGQFIKNLSKNKDSRLVAETILFFSKRIGVKTVAEFVHSKEIYDIVRELGIDYAQGYHLGKPSLELI